MKKQLPYYELHGTRYPRLTCILSILREPDIDPKILNHAAQRGTAIHRMINETLISGQVAKLPKTATTELRFAWEAWCAWRALQPASFEWTGVEQTLISSAYGYGTTVDFTQRRMVTEWKVTSKIREKHWIQLHAQVPLIFKEHREEVKVRVVRLDPRLGEFEEVVRPWNEGIWQTFLKLKDIYCDWYKAEYREGWTDERSDGQGTSRQIGSPASPH